MKGLQVYVVEDVHEVFGIGNEGNATTAFDSMVDMEMELEMEGETKDGGGNGAQDREIWLERQLDEPLDVNDASIFYAEFTPLPDFPCMSSSSSSSSTPTPVKAMTCSSSSSASFSSSAAFWAALKPDADEDVERSHTNHEQHDLVDASTTALSSTASMEIPQALTDQQIDADDCMDMMETFGYMDLFENNDFFDHSSIFQIDDEKLLEDFQQVQQDFTQQEEQQRPPHPQHGNKEWTMPPTKNSEDTQQGEGGGKGAASDDLAMVFLEWLKTNKESVSAEDLRKVKIKKATIECAARRLGGGKEAMKQLLKLILEWVQTNHLQKRRMRASSSSNPPCQYQDSLQNPSTNPILKPSLNCTNSTLPDQSNPCFTQSPWIPTAAPYVAGPETVVPGFPSMVGYMGDPFTNGASNINGHLYPPPADYHVLESGPSWPGSQFAMASHYTPFADNNLHHSASPHLPATFTRNRKQYSYQYAPGQGESLVGPGSSATKEARKKRMARQRRFLSHHRRQSHPKSQQQQNLVADPHAGLGIGNDNGAPPGRANLGNWAYWPTATSAAPVATSPAPPVLPLDAQPAPSAHRPAMQLQAQHYQRQLASERRQGWKPEKNLRFLLQKVLKQSDVGNLGRIVLPKKEAETHLPELEARDGISIVMEDIGTSRVWNMRYRFWPNNKSRMYLLENTGDFVRTNGLQEGDFIVIYSDVKCGKYLIRGVKVRHAAPKAENKRSGKSERNWHARSASNASGSSSKPVPQMQTQLHTQTVN